MCCLLFLSTPCSSKYLTSRTIELTMPPQDRAINKSYGTITGPDAMLWSCNCHAGKGIAAGATMYIAYCPAATYQPAFITSEPTNTPHHRTTIDSSEPIGSRGTVAKGRYCHVGEDIADAATILAPFTVLKRRQKNDHFSAPTRPTTTAPRRKRWRERWS